MSITPNLNRLVRKIASFSLITYALLSWDSINKQNPPKHHNETIKKKKKIDKQHFLPSSSLLCFVLFVHKLDVT